MRKVCIDKIEELDMLIDNRLSVQKKQDLKEHMGSCEACRLYFEDIVSIKSSLSKLDLQVPAGLTAGISSAVRKEKKKIKNLHLVYRYASVAAACLVVVAAAYAFRGLNFGNKSTENAEMLQGESFTTGSLERNGIDAYEGDSLTESTLGTDNVAAVPAATMAPKQPSEETADMELDNYSYKMSALNGSESKSINPSGISLDTGFEEKQDVFYASKAYSLNEINKILINEYGIEEIKREENTLSFYMDSFVLAKMELRLDLVAAHTLESDAIKVKVRIKSLLIN